jgi:hypothetical protein
MDIEGRVLTYDYIQLNFLCFTKYKPDLFNFILFLAQVGWIYQV